MVTQRFSISSFLEALLGFPAGAFDGRPESFLDLLEPLDRERFQRAVDDASERNSGPEAEFRLVGIGSQPRWFSSKSTVVRNANGAAVRLVGTMQEIPASVVTERRMRLQQAALLSLLTEHRIAELPLRDSLRHITEVAAATLGVERTSVWLFTADRTSIRCLDLFLRSSRQHTVTDELVAKHYPNYFRALDENRTLAAANARSDSRTSELFDEYLAPPGITSMLEAAIRRGGQTIGVVCHEHVGLQRQWLLDEQSFAASIADMVAMQIESDERSRLAAELAKSEERYRTFLSLSSEAILRAELITPLDISAPAGEQLVRLARDAVVTEWNPALAKLLGMSSLDSIQGRAIGSLVSANIFNRLLEEWVASNYRMTEHEFGFVSPAGEPIWLLGSMIGTVANGKVTGIWGTWRDITQRKEALSALEFQALHDSLTGLPNRKWLTNQLGDMLREADSAQCSISLLLMDLDHFKEINDTLGHYTGDQLLKLIGPRLKPVLKQCQADLVRLGGDEFAVISRGCGSAQEASALAGRIVRALRQPFDVAGMRLDIGVSVGIALFPEHGRDGSTLLRCADAAMYAAKRGRGGFTLYKPEEDRNSPRRAALMQDLGEAIRGEAIEVHYQPKVDLRTRELVGIEALVRWRHPVFGMIEPDEFLALAEMGDLIRQMTMLVLNRAAAQWRAWQASGIRTVMAINVSPRVLVDHKFSEDVEAALRQYGMPGDSLDFEITEKSVLADPKRALATLTRLHLLGVHFAIDDFGMGFSSLSYLKQLPIHSLKIDRSFVMGRRAQRARRHDRSRDNCAGSQPGLDGRSGRRRNRGELRNRARDGVR